MIRRRKKATILDDPRYLDFVDRYLFDVNRFAVEVCGQPPTWQQRQLFDAVTEIAGSRVSVSSGHGCFGIGTMMMRADGTAVAVEDIRVGDQLMGPDGNSVRNVLELKRGREAMYRFTLSDGSAYVFNESHDLCLQASSKYGHLGDASGRLIVQVREFLSWSETKRKRFTFYRSGVTEFSRKAPPLPIPPYVLGCWLGDGSAGSATICCPDEEVLGPWEGFVTSRGCGVSRRVNSVSKDGVTCWVSHATRIEGNTNPVMGMLRELGVLDNKHIPDAYLYASLEDRRQLVAGLLDTDGHLDRNASGYDWTQKDERLARQFWWLVRSIGCHATIRQCRKGCQTGAVGTYWRVTVGRCGTTIPCRVARKKSDLPEPKPLLYGVKAVEPLGEGDYYGFVLDADRRFLLHDFTIQKNTGKTSAAGVLVLWHLLVYKHSNTILSGPKLDTVLSGIRKYVADLLPNISAGPYAWVAEHVVLARKSIYIRGFQSQWWVEARTAPPGKPEGLAGMHRKYMLWLLDEASGMDDPAINVIMGSVTEDCNKVVMFSQPTRNTGFFYDTHHRLSKRKGGVWTSLTFDSEESPLVTDAFIREKIVQYGGRTDPQYLIKVRGLFPENLAGQLLSRSTLEGAIGAKPCISDDEDWGWLVSVDVGAGEYRDKSVVTVMKAIGFGQSHEPEPRRVHVVDFPIISNSIQPTELGAEVLQIAGRLSNCTVLIDGGGLGLAVYKRMVELGMSNAVKVLWGNPCFRVELKDCYFNQRAQAMVGIARAARAGQFTIAADAFHDMRDRNELLDQGSRIPYTFNDRAQYVIFSKRSKEWEGLPSPDIWDSCSLAFLEDATVVPSDTSGSGTDALRSRVINNMASALEQAIAS